jgi:hypothetical protein
MLNCGFERRVLCRLYCYNVHLIEKKDILAPGTVILSGNFKLVKKIEDLNEFWAVLKHKKSFYARHRMYPPSFS